MLILPGMLYARYSIVKLVAVYKELSNMYSEIICFG
jgi:hypothetical protein